MEFAAPMPPNMPEVEVPLPNDSSISNYCWFMQAVLSMAPMEGFDVDFDLGLEQVDSDPPNKARVCFILYVDITLWNCVMKTNDLEPKLLRWYLQLKKFDFMVCDKVNVHTLSDPDQA